MARSACSLQIILSLLSSSLVKGGNVDREIRLQDEHWSQASTPIRWRQFMALVNSSANSFFPMPSSPVKSIEPGTLPPERRRRRDSLTSSFPISLENISVVSVSVRQSLAAIRALGCILASWRRSVYSPALAL